MAQTSAIEWTEATWNPVVGCAKVSSGCANCYAERMANRLAAMAKTSQGSGDNSGRKANYVRVVNAKGQWNGTVYLDESSINDPLGWRNPRLVFVNSMSDLFHEDVPLSFIMRILDVMNRCQRHTFQILTKRPERAVACSASVAWTPNIWMGTSIENASLTHRAKSLQRIPAHVRFLSLEPLLGPIPRLPLSRINWVIVGGESGPGARPMEIEWARQIRDRCTARGVPFFFKQWGGVNKKAAGRILDGRTWDELPRGAAIGNGKHNRGR